MINMESIFIAIIIADIDVISLMLYTKAFQSFKDIPILLILKNFHTSFRPIDTHIHGESLGNILKNILKNLYMYPLVQWTLSFVVIF